MFGRSSVNRGFCFFNTSLTLKNLHDIGVLLYICSIQTNKNKGKMKGYRYNAKNRADRKFNNCGKEKNPNAVKFFAPSLEAAEPYRFVHFEDGDINYECDLEVVDLPSAKLFDMASNFKSLNCYTNYIADQIEAQKAAYMHFMKLATNAKSRKNWEKQIENLKNREAELMNSLIICDFQQLSDFENQAPLIAELKALGFDGYFTKNEIAIF